MEPPVSILWFRHGLRLHDNPSLHEAVQEAQINGSHLLLIFIFDGETAGTKLCGLNRYTFLLECLKDIDDQLQILGTKLHVCHGAPIEIFEAIHKSRGIAKLCFEQDCEPVWKTRDEGVKNWCNSVGVPWVEKIGHTLWNPHEVLALNGGTPPVTFAMFNHVISAMSKPDRPMGDVDFSNIQFASMDEELGKSIGLHPRFPSIEYFNLEPEMETDKAYIGGERVALKALELRLAHEYDAFKRGTFLPNQRDPDVLCPPKSLSPDLRFGSLSVRKFYWGVLDAFKKSQQNTKKPFNPRIISQLLWREFFYTMSVGNDHYDEMERNEICVNIPWTPVEGNPHWKAFLDARTGFPFIDAGMRQLYKEGWTHHVVRNAIACFLTRGDLWISWEHGLKVFLKYLLDADWSVCAGNWLWISSSSFEEALKDYGIIDPCQYGRRVDPWGKYVQKYIPELSKFPVEYIYEPWLAPKEVQETAGCVIGKDYPEPIVDHQKAAAENTKRMADLKEFLTRQLSLGPSPCVSPVEILDFDSLAENFGTPEVQCCQECPS